MTKTARRAVRTLTLLLVAAVAWLAAGTPAHAAEAVNTYQVEAAVQPDGSLQVVATIAFEEPPANLVQVFSTATRTPDSTEYRFAISDVKATGGGADLQPTVTAAERTTTISLPTAGVTGPVQLSYVVRGTSMSTADGGTTTVWAFLQGLNVPVTKFQATVWVPGPFTSLDCMAGDPAAPGACTYYGGGTHDNPLPVFYNEGIQAGGFVQATLRFPAGVVAVDQDLRTLWTAERAFSTGPAELISALAIALLGGLGLWFVHRRIGRDAAGAATPALIAEFHPIAEGQSEFRLIDDVRPGQVGTVLDEHVDPVDVTATLLDLAVRGHLRIEELPRPSIHAPSDWAFHREDATGPLAGYEQTLLDAVAPANAAEPVRVSMLAAAVGPVVPQVQSQLYDEVVARGWFARRPDTTRNVWARLGWAILAVAVAVTIVLAAFTSFGLLGVALILLALGVVFVAAEMPARTMSGTSVLRGLQVLSGTLQTQPTDQLPAGRELEQFGRILPYAVVLGGADRWLSAMAGHNLEADSSELPWYHAGPGWRLADLPDSVRNFVTTVQGTLFTR